MRTHFSMGRLTALAFLRGTGAARRRGARGCAFAVEGLEQRTLLSGDVPMLQWGMRGRQGHHGNHGHAGVEVAGGTLGVTPAVTLAAPTGVMVVGATTTSIRVEWDAVAGADHYSVLQRKVLHDPKGSGSKIYYVGVGTTAGTSLTLNLLSGTFEVVAVDASGVTSAPSALASGSALTAPSLYNFLWGGAVMSSATVEVGQTLNVTLLGYGNEKPTYAMDSGPATMSVDAMTGVVTFTPTAAEAGYESATFTATNSVGSSTATFQFHILSLPTVVVTGGTFTFDGQTHGASAVAYGTDGVTPVAGAFSILYAPAAYPSALSTAPYAEAGSYLVQATFTSSDPNYGGAAGSSTVVINPATPVMAMADTEVAYNGGMQTIPAVALGVDGKTAVNGTYVTTYNGSLTVPIDPGTYAVVTTFTSSDRDYTDVTASATLTIDPAVGPLAPTLVLASSETDYDGSGQGATAVAVAGDGVTGIAGTFRYLYDGSPTLPTDAGTYTVEADFTSADPHFTDGVLVGTLTIDPAVPTVTVVGGTYTYDGQPHGATVSVVGVDGVTAVAGDVTWDYDGMGTGPVDAGTWDAFATFTSGDPNYAGAAGSGVVVINPAMPVFSNLSAGGTGDGRTRVTGKLAAGSVSPGGDSVAVRLAGMTQAATVDTNGLFTAYFAGLNLTAGQRYTVRCTFAGDYDFNAASATLSYVPTAVLPQILLQPAPQTVTAGSLAVFRVVAAGVSASQIQWRVSTDGGTTFSDIAGATGNTYAFAADLSENGFEYCAVIRSSGGKLLTLAALLTVLPA